MPKRVQLSRRRGWRMPPDTVKVDRSTRWGNPFRVGVDGDAARCVALYRDLMAGKPIDETAVQASPACMVYAQLQRVRLGELRGKDLACWCKPGEPCHADVLLELANDEAVRKSFEAWLRETVAQTEAVCVGSASETEGP